MQVVGVGGGVPVQPGWMDRLGVEVASILNVSVSGIFLYASLTTCVPASEKERNLK